MKLLEELKQRTIEKKTLKEYEETSKVYLEKWYEEYSKQLRHAADNGFDCCMLLILKMIIIAHLI